MSAQGLEASQKEECAKKTTSSLKEKKKEQDQLPERAEDDQVSEFFNNLSMQRGKPNIKKFVDDDNDSGLQPLTKEELDQISYPYPHITFVGAAGITDMLYGCKTVPKKFRAPNGKAFTVRQLATALAKAEEHNQNAHHCFFEGL